MESRQITISLSLGEAWAVRDYMRRHQEYGVVWDRNDMRAIHNAVLALTADPSTSEYEVLVEEGTLWLIEQQIPSTLTIGSDQVGRKLLLKVMGVLQTLDQEQETPKTEADEARTTVVPGAFERSFLADDASSAAALAGFDRYLQENRQEVEE